jgi:hypothetical protein
MKLVSCNVNYIQIIRWRSTHRTNVLTSWRWWCSFGLWRHVDSEVDTNDAEKHTVSIFRAEDGNSCAVIVSCDTVCDLQFKAKIFLACFHSKIKAGLQDHQPVCLCVSIITFEATGGCSWNLIGRWCHWRWPRRHIFFNSVVSTIPQRRTFKFFRLMLYLRHSALVNNGLG